MKKYMVLSIILIGMNSITLGSSTGSNFVSNVVKNSLSNQTWGAFSSTVGGGAMAPSVAGSGAMAAPRATLTPQQRDRVVQGIARSGHKNAGPALVSYWQQNPQVTAEMRGYVASGNVPVNYFRDMARVAEKEFDKSISFFDVKGKNTELKSLLEDVENKVVSTQQEISPVFYRHQAASDTMHDMYREIGKINYDLLTMEGKANLTPQAAAREISTILDKTIVKDFVKELQGVKDSIKHNSILLREVDGISDNLIKNMSDIKQSLEKVKAILQKTPSTKAERVIPYAKFEEMIHEVLQSAEESFAMPEKVLTSDQIEQVKNTMMPMVQNAGGIIVTMQEQLGQLVQQLRSTSLNFTADEKTALTLLIEQQYKNLVKAQHILLELESVSQDFSIAKFQYLSLLLQVIMNELIANIAELKHQISLLDTNKQQALTTILQECVNRLIEFAQSQSTMRLVVEHYYKNVELFENMKNEIKLTAFRDNAIKLVDKASETFNRIVKLVEINKALFDTAGYDFPTLKELPTNVSVFQNKIVAYKQVYEKLATVKSLEELEVLQNQIEVLHRELLQSITALREQIEYMSVAMPHNNALKEELLRFLQELEKSFQDLSHQVTEKFAKIREIKQFMLFVDIRKNEIEMGIQARVRQALAINDVVLQISTTQGYELDTLTLEQRELLDQLRDEVADMLETLKELHNKKYDAQNVRKNPYQELETKSKEQFAKFDALLQKISIKFDRRGVFAAIVVIAIIGALAYEKSQLEMILNLLGQQDDLRKLEELKSEQVQVLQSIDQVVSSESKSVEVVEQQLDQIQNNIENVAAEVVTLQVASESMLSGSLRVDLLDKNFMKLELSKMFREFLQQVLNKVSVLFDRVHQHADSVQRAHPLVKFKQNLYKIAEPFDGIVMYQIQSLAEGKGVKKAFAQKQKQKKQQVQTGDDDAIGSSAGGGAAASASTEDDDQQQQQQVNGQRPSKVNFARDTDFVAYKSPFGKISERLKEKGKKERFDVWAKAKKERVDLELEEDEAFEKLTSDIRQQLAHQEALERMKNQTRENFAQEEARRRDALLGEEQQDLLAPQRELLALKESYVLERLPKIAQKVTALQDKVQKLISNL